MDRVNVTYSSRGAGTARPISDWSFVAGEQYQRNRSIEMAVSLTNDRDRTFLRAARLATQRGSLRAMVGDVEPIVVDGVATLHRLRGAALFGDPVRGPSWRLMGGVPTPVPGFDSRRVAVGGFVMDRLRLEEATVSLGVLGFDREAARPAFGATPADSLAGSGGEAYVGLHAPSPVGTIGYSVGGGWQNLDGTSGLTARQVLEWQLSTPEFIADVSDRRSTGGARLIATDALAPAPVQEDRLNLRMRALEGRGETHVTGVLRRGGPTELETQTVQVGGSGSWGLSAWYSSTDFTWDRRGAGLTERRLSVQTGRAARGGGAFAIRLRRNTNDAGREVLQAGSEALVILPRGMRVSVEPRASWADRRFEDAQVDSRLTLPLPWTGLRVLGGFSIGAGRDAGFDLTLREAEIGLSIAPRPRDRGELEARRISDGRTTQYEYGGSYSFEGARYESPTGSWLSRADSGRVIVRVVRSGNLSGVPNVLVSLDDKELRFTDEQGYARFDRTEPGIHVVAVAERSLPEELEVVQSGRVFVTVERGRLPDPVIFQVARPVRRKAF